MAVYLTTEKKEEIFTKHGGSGKNTGSVEGQVALFYLSNQCTITTPTR